MLMPRGHPVRVDIVMSAVNQPSLLSRYGLDFASPHTVLSVQVERQLKHSHAVCDYAAAVFRYRSYGSPFVKSTLATSFHAEPPRSWSLHMVKNGHCGQSF